MTVLRKSQQEHTRSFERAYLGGWRPEPTTHHRLIYRAKPDFKKRGIEKILDVGCGRGLVVVEMMRDGFDVTGTEIVPCLLSRELKRLPVLPYNVGGLGQFDDNEFDLVLMVDLLDYLRDEQDVDLALGHANRLARQGIIVTLGGDSPHQCIKEEREWWRGKLGNSIEFPMETATCDGGVCRYTFWRPSE